MDPARIRIVLVETSHPGNIGAAARAMKTMGLGSLWLVNPAVFPHAEATARASGADDVLHEARVCTTLAEALAGCRDAIATSARARELGVPELSAREAASRAWTTAVDGDVALVFGRERTGLSNEELELCQAMVRIPTVPGFSSLNVASAVQLLSYEVRLCALEGQPAEPADVEERVGIDELEGLFAHYERALDRIGYLDPARPGRLMRRLRRLYSRSGIEPSELRILRGILTAAERCVDERDAARSGDGN